MIWDIEGEPPGAAIYVGDPRAMGSLSPEMEFKANGRPVADEYFKIFADAGLRTGLTIRPTRYRVTGDRVGIQDRAPNVANELAAKVS